STIASAGGSKRSSESGSIRLVTTAPPIIDGGWFQALANRVRKSSIRKGITRYSMEELVFEREAAAEYDRAFAHVTRYFMPFVLRAARIVRGMRILDIAAGTGLSAEAALSAVGPTGHVTAADISPAMAEKARERLGEARNASVLVEDAQALSFSDETFDAVVCNLGLMFFPEPARGLSEFRRVLRPGGRAAVSVNTVPERSYNHQINVILTRVCTRFGRSRHSHFFAGRGVPARSVVP